jgi:hypothetical protein
VDTDSLGLLSDFCTVGGVTTTVFRLFAGFETVLAGADTETGGARRTGLGLGIRTIAVTTAFFGVLAYDQTQEFCITAFVGGSAGVGLTGSTFLCCTGVGRQDTEAALTVAGPTAIVVAFAFFGTDLFGASHSLRDTLVAGKTGNLFAAHFTTGLTSASLILSSVAITLATGFVDAGLTLCTVFVIGAGTEAGSFLRAVTVAFQTCPTGERDFACAVKLAGFFVRNTVTTGTDAAVFAFCILLALGPALTVGQFLLESDTGEAVFAGQTGTATLTDVFFGAIVFGNVFAACITRTFGNTDPPGSIASFVGSAVKEGLTGLFADAFVADQAVFAIRNAIATSCIDIATIHTLFFDTTLAGAAIQSGLTFRLFFLSTGNGCHAEQRDNSCPQHPHC